MISDAAIRATRDHIERIDRDIAASDDPVHIRRLQCLRASIAGDLKRWTEQRRREDEQRTRELVQGGRWK